MAGIKRLLPRGLFGRSLLIIVLPLVLLQGVTAYIFYERHWDAVSRRLALGLAGDIAVVIQSLRESPDPRQQERFLSFAEPNMELEIALEPEVILPNVGPLVTNRILDRMLTRALDERLVYPFQIDTRSFDEKVQIRVQLPDSVLTVMTPRKRLFSSTTYIFVMWMVGTSLILIGIAVYFLRNQMKPIRRLATAAENFGKGRPVAEFKPEGAREIRQAATAFIEMRERIQRQIQQRTEMLAGVSHDLRTPLTRMKLQLAMLGDDKAVESLSSDVDEMERMIGEYLAFARGEGSEEARLTPLNDLLRDVVAGALRQGSTIEVQLAGELTARVRPGALKRCITNVVENAMRYADRITLQAARRGDVIEIVVEDDGPGIPEADRIAVFKPFHRLDPSRNPETGGAGLGLTIARDVMHAHGGEILLGEAALGGLRVELRLPV
jgi:two-component system, OmpR family, osmolarity sensor histidine kinase EnvZ